MVRLLDRVGVEGQLRFPGAPVVPAQLLRDQLVWEASGALRDRLRQAEGPAVVELAEAFPCPFTLPSS